MEFLADGIEYDYEIHAGSGKILDWDNERADDRYGDLDEWFTGAGGKDQWDEDKDDADSVNHGKDIGGGQAKRIALNHAGVKKADALRLRADREDGRYVYLVECIADGREYENEILAADGTVLDHDSDEADWDDKKDKNDKFDRDDDDDDDDDDADDRDDD